VTLYTVIGARGFIGAHLVERLHAEGVEVYAPDRGDESLLDRDLGRVFYCAGLTGDYRSRPFDAVEAHVALLARLLERGRFERLVYLSSTRLYGESAHAEEHLPLTLNPNDPEHLYELSKALGESLVLHRSGGRGRVARLSYVFDWTPEATGFLSDWLAFARTGRDISLAGHPDGARDYIHRDDAVAALRAILDGQAPGLFNVASGRLTSNAELAQVFTRAGWRTTFASGEGPVRPPAPPAIARLSALGVQPRDVRELVAEVLAGLTPPPT